MKLLNCAASLACFAALTTACATPPDLVNVARPQAVIGAAGSAQPAPPALASATQAPADSRNTEPQTQVARYTTLSLRPSDADENPLAVIATVHFPRQVVRTVGDAVRYLLIRTGYQLAPADTLDPRVSAVFALPLPDNQRALGPYRVDSILAVLMGQPYRLVSDPLARTVSYAAPAANSNPQATAPRSAGLAQTGSN